MHYKFKNKSDIIKTIKKITNNNPKKMAFILHELRRVGMLFATIYGQTFKMSDMNIIDEDIIKLQEKVSDKPEENEKLKNEVISKLKKLAQEKNINNQILFATDIGASRGYDNIANLVGFRGHFVNAKNEFVDIPVKSSLLDGLTKEEFLAYGNAARKGILDRVMMTSKPGYFMRQSVYALDVQIDTENICKPKGLLRIHITDKNKTKVLYRYIKVGNQDILLTEDNIDKFVDKHVDMYSPIFCTLSKSKICKRCAGEVYKIYGTIELGILAATSVSEQLYTKLLKSFHTGARGQIIKPTTDKITFNKKI